MTRISGGRFFDAADAGELGDAVAAALQPPFAVRDLAGAHSIEFCSDPPREFPNVAGGNGEVLELSLADSA